MDGAGDVVLPEPVPPAMPMMTESSSTGQASSSYSASVMNSDLSSLPQVLQTTQRACPALLEVIVGVSHCMQMRNSGSSLMRGRIDGAVRVSRWPTASMPWRQKRTDGGLNELRFVGIVADHGGVDIAVRRTGLHHDGEVVALRDERKDGLMGTCRACWRAR